MEQTHPTPEISAWREGLQQRLKAHAEMLMGTLETAEKPVSFTDIARAARALMAVVRLADAIDCQGAAAPGRRAKPAKTPPVPALLPPFVPKMAAASGHALAGWTPDAAPPVTARRRLPGL